MNGVLGFRFWVLGKNNACCDVEYRLRKLKSFKMMKQNYYFNIFPEVPLISLIKKKGLKFFIKNLLPILIDKHEF